MSVILVSEENDAIRRTFFQTVFGGGEGYIAVALKSTKGLFREAFFHYPDQLDHLLGWINTNFENRNLYFCPHLFKEKQRVKPKVASCLCLWADLDEVESNDVQPIPSYFITSSEGRYQGIWMLDKLADPYSAEDASRRLTYALKADPSGWDLTQLLRIPFTYNMKYEEPEIVTVTATTRVYKIADFDTFEEVPEFKILTRDLPDLSTLDPDEILSKYRRILVPSVFTIYTQAPDKDWSSTLWSLECTLIESGMSAEEAFVVARASATNKYERDGRGEDVLWREVLKAQASIDLKRGAELPPFELEPLMSDAERVHVNSLEETFIDRYIAWGRSRTDAAWVYHQAGALMILSATLADKVKLDTSFGSILPNLWLMLLGDSTLTRKTVSMEMAMDVVNTVAEDTLLATDGSMEGILTALSTRAHRTSVFWRDEFAGMLDSMQKRDYHTGMIEALTKLYDGKYLKRILRRETVEVRDPILIMYAGGIRARILELLSEQYVLSGFVPRFIFFVGETDLTSFRPLGPPAKATSGDGIYDEIGKIHYNYTSQSTIKVGNQIAQSAKVWEAELTPQAWARYNTLEATLVEAGTRSDSPDLYTPTMDRLSKSTLKSAVLIAASRQHPPVTVEEDDVLRAITMVERWVPASASVVQNAGKSASERSMERALSLIRNGKDSRSGLMRSMHLQARETDVILDTLEQRGLVVRTKYGKVERIFPTGGTG